MEEIQETGEFHSAALKIQRDCNSDPGQIAENVLGVLR
jgi:hypothetical protein